MFFSESGKRLRQPATVFVGNSSQQAEQVSTVPLIVESLEDRLLLSAIDIFAAGVTNEEQIELQIESFVPGKSPPYRIPVDLLLIWTGQMAHGSAIFRVQMT